MTAVVKRTTPQMTGSQFFDTVLQIEKSGPYQQQVVEYNHIRNEFFHNWGLSTERYHWLQLRVAQGGTDQLNTQWCWDTSHDQLKIFFNYPKDPLDPKNKFLTMLYLKYTKSK
jgi:hypothetical protein